MPFHVTSDGNRQSRFGENYGTPGGVARLVAGPFAHRIGGESWQFTGSLTPDERPTLILTLDLTDPICKLIDWGFGKELPLCSHLVDCHWVNPQFFQIDPDRRSISILEFSPVRDQPRFPEFLTPIPETPISIELMMESDLPTTEQLYWSIGDEFVGGANFIRILGTPYWLQDVQQVVCRCGNEMQYIASQGYADQRSPSPLENLLFFGEAAFYWFFCKECSILGVITQST